MPSLLPRAAHLNYHASLSMTILTRAAEEYRDAIIEQRNVLRLAAANAAAIRGLGRAHFILGEMGQAFRFLLRAQEVEPDNAEVRPKLASIYRLGGKPDEAQAQAAAVVEKQPKHLRSGNNIGALMLAGVIHERRGDIPRARGFYEAG